MAKVSTLRSCSSNGGQVALEITSRVIIFYGVGCCILDWIRTRDLDGAKLDSHVYVSRHASALDDDRMTDGDTSESAFLLDQSTSRSCSGATRRRLERSISKDVECGLEVRFKISLI